MLVWEKTARVSIVKKQLFLCICLKLLCPWEKHKDMSSPCRDFLAVIPEEEGTRKQNCFCVVSFVGISPDILRNQWINCTETHLNFRKVSFLNEEWSVEGELLAWVKVFAALWEMPSALAWPWAWTVFGRSWSAVLSSHLGKKSEFRIQLVRNNVKLPV